MTSNKSSTPVNKWTWKALGDPPPAKIPMSIKAKASIQAPIMGLVAWFMYYKFHHVTVPCIVGGLAVIVLIGGWFIPPVFHAIERFGQGLAKWVVVILNWGLLAPFFYLCFVPGRLILKLQGIDPMDRTFPSESDSFWIPRKQITDMSQYRKQH